MVLEHVETCHRENPVDVWRETLRRNVVEQAAMMLLQHVKLNNRNSNGNAFDECRYRPIERDESEFKRTDKCNSWLSTLTAKDQRARSSPQYMYRRTVHFHPQVEVTNPSFTFNENVSPYFRSDQISSSFHPMTLSSNALTEPMSQPIIMVHKKRLRRDYFLSTMQNCLQPPYSQNHFYAFDQINMRKLQRNIQDASNGMDQRHVTVRQRIPKRKFPEGEDDNRDLPDCVCSETRLSRKEDDYKTDDLKERMKQAKTVDHETKSHRENSTSEVILSRLEKILGLCGELRSLAKDVESHVNSASEPQRTASRSQSPLSKSAKTKDEEKTDESEQTIIDICKELEVQQSIATIDEKNAPPPYQHTDELVSVYSNSTRSHQLASKKSDISNKSPTNLRKAEDICMCFLKSFLEDQKSKTNCELNDDEQIYLSELTRAYLLGKEQVLKEQQIDQNHSQDQHDSMVKGFSNNNQSVTLSFDIPRSITPVTKSSFLVANQLHQSEKIPSPRPLETNDSMATLAEDDIADQQQKSLVSSVVPSAKHQSFINEPIAMKSTIILPGIGPKYAHLLAECGFPTARRLLGFYLMIKDDQHFVLWLNTKAGVPKHSAWLCAHALRAWCQTRI